MRTVGATEFKAKCLELMDRVAERRETFIITKRGRPVARLVPPDRPEKRNILGCMADETVLLGDIAKPIYTEAEWKEFERQRREQARAWEIEWQTYGTISGKKTVGQPPHMRRGTRRSRRSSRASKR